MPSLDSVVAINSIVTGMDLDAVQRSVKLSLLDSALHAPMAGFGDSDLYPHDHQRLGVLCSRIVRNHPFLDGNKRTGFLAMLRMATLNGLELEFDDQDAAADQIEGLAAGTVDEDSFCRWLESFL